MCIKDFIKSRSFKSVLIIIIAVIVLLLVFQAGIFVGYRKASFAYRFGDNYYRAFGGRHGMEFRVPIRGDFFAAHGVTGKVISINLPTLVVAGPENMEKIILITDDTLIRRFDAAVQPSEIKLGDFIVVIGSPDENSQIEARLIRIAPPPPESRQGESALKSTTTPALPR